MPFEQTWFVQDRIVKVEFFGELTINDIVGSFVTSGKYLEESTSQRVHFIHDWSKLTRFPTNLREIRNSLSITESNMLKKLGWVVIYGAEHQVLRFVGDLTFQLFQIHTHMTKDCHSALAFLQKQDPTLEIPFDKPLLTDVSWYLPGHILYCYDVFTVEDMILRNQNAVKLIEAEGKPPSVHMLIDFSATNGQHSDRDVRQLVKWSTSSPAFQQARDNLIRHPLFGWVVVMSVHSANIDVGGKIVAHKYNYKRKEVDTLTEALLFLKQIDPNIARLLNQEVLP